MANSVDPDQTAPSGAVWSGSALFAYVILSETLVFEFLGHLPYPYLDLRLEKETIDHCKAVHLTIYCKQM